MEIFILPILTLIYDESMRLCENTIAKNCKKMNKNFKGKLILKLNQHFLSHAHKIEIGKDWP